MLRHDRFYQSFQIYFHTSTSWPSYFPKNKERPSDKLDKKQITKSYTSTTTSYILYPYYDTNILLNWTKLYIKQFKGKHFTRNKNNNPLVQASDYVLRQSLEIIVLLALIEIYLFQTLESLHAGSLFLVLKTFLT